MAFGHWNVALIIVKIVKKKRIMQPFNNSEVKKKLSYYQLQITESVYTYKKQEKWKHQRNMRGLKKI